MLNDLDQLVLQVAYEQIGQSQIGRISGSTMWMKMRAVVPDIAPPTISARLRRLVSLCLLVKDKINSSKLTAVYGPTNLGHQWLTKAGAGA